MRSPVVHCLIAAVDAESDAAIEGFAVMRDQPIPKTKAAHAFEKDGAYIQETDPDKQKALVEAMHRRLWEVIPYVPLGQLKQPFIWRKNISGVLKANTLVFWNIEKY